MDELVDVVSKNGTLLLNIGPKADGTIPEHEQQMLHEIGAWLKINGEAIYGTRPGQSSAKARPKLLLVRSPTKPRESIHSGRFPLHHERQNALCHRACVAENRKLVVNPFC